ncbi:hypothetical protein QNH14_01130 [Apirhabdus apintestini]|nr:hypothetical protein QNH14_01130 [Enterobacteriaceae bacterium CA-0114]
MTRCFFSEHGLIAGAAVILIVELVDVVVSSLDEAGQASPAGRQTTALVGL